MPKLSCEWFVCKYISVGWSVECKVVDLTILVCSIVLRLLGVVLMFLGVGGYTVV